MRLALNTVPADFHKVELQHHRSGPFCVDTSSKPFSFPLRGPVRQISTASLFGECESNCGEYLEMTSEHGGVFKDVCLFVLQVVWLCGRITSVVFGGSVREMSRRHSRWSARRRSRPVSAPGWWQFKEWSWWDGSFLCVYGGAHVRLIISALCCQSSCFRWSSGGERERSRKPVDGGERVRKSMHSAQRWQCLKGSAN